MATNIEGITKGTVNKLRRKVPYFHLYLPKFHANGTPNISVNIVEYDATKNVNSIESRV